MVTCVLRQNRQWMNNIAIKLELPKDVRPLYSVDGDFLFQFVARCNVLLDDHVDHTLS